ncbi:hypothetical protein NDU88_009211 [Pleurodeles waltl]|uniref:Uncharacterized protein n=1 Tax=Pleurodeles waltl TaxID=8319 RepID=A0AAV7RVK2_PLEWA|nr:hypothetical protein NDU88_009211 [Pleurodeles waltl]
MRLSRETLGRTSFFYSALKRFPGLRKSDQSRGPEPRLLPVRPQVMRLPRQLRRHQPPRVQDRWLRGRIQLQGLIQQ